MKTGLRDTFEIEDVIRSEKSIDVYLDEKR